MDLSVPTIKDPIARRTIPFFDSKISDEKPRVVPFSVIKQKNGTIRGLSSDILESKND